MKKYGIELEDWRKLYEASARIKEIAPWKWMEEIDVFGVQHPETQEIGFVSVMGMRGEYYSVGTYLGLRALYQFWAFEDAGPAATPEDILEIPQLHASFVNRNELDKKDYAVIKKLGLKFRGKHAWPQFRSHRPGLVPWFVEVDEVRFLLHILEQTADVVLRYKENPELLDMPDDESYLVRVPRQEKGKLCWEDQIMRVTPPEDQVIPLMMDEVLLETARKLPPSPKKVECDLFLMPTPVHEGERPFFPYVLLVVEPQSQMIIGTELLAPQPSLEEMWGVVPIYFLDQLVKAGIRPKEIRIRSSLLHALLQPVAEEFGMKLRQIRRLKGVDAAKESLFQFMMPDDLMDEWDEE